MYTILPLIGTYLNPSAASEKFPFPLRLSKSACHSDTTRLTSKRSDIGKQSDLEHRAALHRKNAESQYECNQKSRSSQGSDLHNSPLRLMNTRQFAKCSFCTIIFALRGYLHLYLLLYCIFVDLSTHAALQDMYIKYIKNLVF